MPFTPAEIQKRLRERRTAAGLCLRCGKEPKLPDKTACEGCLSRERLARRAICRAKKKAGMCVYCDRRSPEGTSLCPSCNLRRRTRNRSRSQQGLCYVCGKNPPTNHPTHKGGLNKRCAECTAKMNAYNQKIKDAAYAAYGGYRCTCCGETEPEFLSVDHVNGDGKAHRIRHIVGTRLYQWLKKHGYPSGFQILCMNCNWAKGHSPDGLCPHQRASRTRL